jgi:hypothetical protein
VFAVEVDVEVGAGVGVCVDAGEIGLVVVGVGDGAGVGIGVEVDAGAETTFVKKSCTLHPSTPESKLIFHQWYPPWRNGPLTTVPCAFADCIPRTDAVIFAEERTFTFALATTRSFSENFVDVDTTGTDAGAGTPVTVTVLDGQLIDHAPESSRTR